MGLLDAFSNTLATNPAAQQGLLNFGLNLMASRGNLGQAIGNAGLAGLQSYNQYNQQDAQKKMQDLQLKEAQMRMEALQRKGDEEKALQEAYKSGFAPKTTFDTSKIMSNDYVSPATNVQRMDIRSGLQNVQQKLMEQGMIPQAMQVQQQMAALTPTKKVKDWKDVIVGGVPKQVPLFEDGTVGQPIDYETAHELKMQDLGGKIGMFNPFTGVQSGAVGKTMAPGEGARLALEQARFAREGQNMERPTFSQEAGGFVYRPNAQFPTGRVVAPQGMQPKAGSMTASEDERKAAGWYQQANLAKQNMQQAMQEEPGVERKPVIASAIGAVPGFGGVSNMLKSPARQKFEQGASSFAEATLRAATGAGVNKDEAAQKIAELTPQIGDSDAVIQQKLNSQQMYLDSLIARAGRAAPKQSMQPQNAKGVIKFLGFE